ncbi:secretoglobin family 2A member 2-like [Apodemus sylvaticus]|uniref:secretoglobin family 2A member 2-like n=1 Tax=Apodemus sylvaticus TaxID=10129 RepID=UPI002241CFBE|nr:secretoglobin family 2A member 2-like [Apodemus sylvaticus]
MKLVVLFMLVTIPICCYASGSGCRLLDYVIESTIDSSVSVKEYLKVFFPNEHEHFSKAAVEQFKQCFLDQSKESLANIEVMMEAIYNSDRCQQS